MRRNRASFASGGRSRCGLASRRRQASTRLGGRAAWRRRLAALALVWGGRRCEPDGRAVGGGRASGMKRSADVEPQGRRRRQVGDQPRRPQPRSRSETARSRHESVPSGAEGVAAPDWAESATRRRNGSTERNGGRPSATVCGRIIEDVTPERVSVVRQASGASAGVVHSDQRERAKEDNEACCWGECEDAGAEAPSERSERRRCQAARSSWSFLNQASSLRRRRRASGVHLARGFSSVRRWNQRRN